MSARGKMERYERGGCTRKCTPQHKEEGRKPPQPKETGAIQKMNLVGRALRLWFGHQENSVESRAKASDGGDVRPQMCDKDAIHNDLSGGVGAKNSPHLQSNLADSIEKPVERCVFKINEGRIGACYTGYGALNAGDNFYGGWKGGCVGHSSIHSSVMSGVYATLKSASLAS
jgi:hypothetical protein